MLKVYQLLLRQNTFEATFPYRGVGVRVAFVDGNTYNGTPARCYTNDEFKQRAIEASKMFQDKQIVLERSVEEESDRQKAAAKAAKLAAQQPQPEPAPSPTPTQPVLNPAPTPGDGGTQAPEPTGDGSKEMDFANLGEAIQYIATTWNIPVQTEAEARKVLKEHGINPHIKKG